MKGGYNHVNKGKGKGKSKTFKTKRMFGGKKMKKGGSLKLHNFLPYNTNILENPISTTLGGKTRRRRSTIRRINKKIVKGGNMFNIIGNFDNLSTGGSINSFGNTLGNQGMSNILGAYNTENGDVTSQSNLLK